MLNHIQNPPQLGNFFGRLPVDLQRQLPGGGDHQ